MPVCAVLPVDSRVRAGTRNVLVILKLLSVPFFSLFSLCRDFFFFYVNRFASTCRTRLTLYALHYLLFVNLLS